MLLALVTAVLYLSRDALPGLSPLVRELIAALLEHAAHAPKQEVLP